MQQDVRVNLLFDPYDISQRDGTRVFDFESEKKAFREIEDLLGRDARFETVQPKIYIIAKNSSPHFDTYRHLSGVKTEEVSPRTRIRELLRAEPPDWLTNTDICEWKLLDRDPPSELLDDGWPVTIASWLIPGLDAVGSLEEWLAVVACASFTGQYGNDPVSICIQNSFSDLASRVIQSSEVVSELRVALTRAESPVAFANEWLRRKSLLPLVQSALDNPLRTAGIDLGSASERVIAGHLPVVFSLPSSLHVEVSRLMRDAVHQSRIIDQTRLSEVVLRLNAIWDGVPEELRIWLDMYPRGLTEKAALHLEGLPGYQSNDIVRRVVGWYSPPSQIAPWSGLTEGIDEWINKYAQFLRRCFVRREFVAENDPADSFGRWLKDNYAVSFNHAEHSYCRLSQLVKTQLSHERCVILVLVDALAIHIVQDLIGFVSKTLGQDYTTYAFLFGPIPTVTDVCKNAVLTGCLPDACRGDLRNQLSQAYGITGEELLLAADWKDAERTEITESTRLIVYRDNRIDDRLHKLENYATLLEECPEIFRKIASRLHRWVRDVELVRGHKPLVLVTADHGFTFGPQPGVETKGHQILDGKHRCLALTDTIGDADLNDDSITVIDKDQFHLSRNYLAARGRNFGQGTMSGWSLSHGGLLPEEVIIPLVEWYGDEVAVPWPQITFSDGALVEEGNLLLATQFTNLHGSVFKGGTVLVKVSGEDVQETKEIPRLEPGDSASIEIVLAMLNVPNRDNIPIDVTLSMPQGSGCDEVVKHEEFLVPRKKRLVERTKGQADFESMF